MVRARSRLPERAPGQTRLRRSAAITGTVQRGTSLASIRADQAPLSWIRGRRMVVEFRDRPAPRGARARSHTPR
jgi:hypothetical protein